MGSGGGDLTSLPGPIAAQVEELLRFSDLEFKVDAIESGCGGQSPKDRFAVGHVRFDACRPWAAPDVVFGEDAESFLPLLPSAGPAGGSGVSIGAWGILRDWHAEDRARLLKLVLALRRLYLQHQWGLAEAVEDARVRFELSTLAHTPGTEVRVVQTGTWGRRKVEEVQVAMPLQPLDLSALAPFEAMGTVLGTSPGAPATSQPRLLLQASFAVGKGGGAPGSMPSGSQIPQLRLSCPGLLEAVLALADFKLPLWTPTTCCIEYEAQVREQAQGKVREAAEGLQSRHAFLAALAAGVGPPLETDTVMFLRATLSCSTGPFYFLVRVPRTGSFLLHLLLSPRFPQVQPSLQLQSMQHFDGSGRPIFSPVLDSYPWSPRWDAQEMVRRISQFLMEEAPRFRICCS